MFRKVVTILLVALVINLGGIEQLSRAGWNMKE